MPERPSGTCSLVSNSRPSEGFAGKTNSDLAFLGNYVIQGQLQGYQVWDISDPAHPTLKTALRVPGVAERRVRSTRICIFESSEAPTARLDCGADAPKDTVSRCASVASESGTLATSSTRRTSPTCRRAEGRIRTRAGRSERTPPTSISMSPVPRPCGRRASSPAVSVRIPTRIRTRQDSGSRSSKSRSRIPSRPRS